MKNKPPGTPEPVPIPDVDDLEWTHKEEEAFLAVLEDVGLSDDFS